MVSPSVHSSPFTEIFDVVVVGSGYAGFAAAATLRRQGRSVLLLGARGDLVWESGRGFCPEAGTCDDAVWRELADAVAARGGSGSRAAGDWLDGAIAEVVATDQLMAGGAAVLYYAQPVAVERAGDAVTSLVVATKSGPRRVAGRQWIDATEAGELLRLIEPGLTTRAPRSAHAYLMLQHADWSSVTGATGLRPTAWPSERVLGVEVKADDAAWREQLLIALADLEETIGSEIANVSATHLSIEPVPRYDPGVAALVSAPNVVSAVPGHAAEETTTLADRFMLGVRAATELAEREAHEVSLQLLSQPLPPVAPERSLRADVCVAGVGTGGAVAAVAAARAGATVACVDPLPFAGGIGTGGGIHAYYFGIPGGLQQEVDRRTRELMKRFRGGPLRDGPFNPWAKMIVLERMLREHHVDLRTTALLFDVEKRDGHVTAALVATPEGVLRVQAASFVDGTGDGDLCALAGADFAYGRDHDGMPHAYSQSSGKIRELHGRPRMGIVNFDAGFCDPTDPLDITRARLTGVRQYLLDSYDNDTRPTYIAPALGLRQARQVVTEYVLTLDDQIRRRRFHDPIGYTGANFDNHATDYEFESDEAVFWIWASRQWTLMSTCEMSYRMLVPRGLDNIWIASRCLGVTQDAHYNTRMQRDMQRAGEAAGFAAAEAVKRSVTAVDLPYAALRTWLDRTGALDEKPRDFDTDFGSIGDTERWGDDAASTATEAVAALDRGEPGEATWWLYRHEDLVRDAVLERLAPDGGRRPIVSWLAASIAAMWGHPAAEPRLIEAIESLEYGFGDDYDWTARGRHLKTDDIDPLTWSKVVPNWLCAVAVLRRCGTEACLPALERLLERPVHGVNTLTSVALTLERLVRRGVVTSDDARERITAMLDRIPSIRVVGALDYSARSVGRYSEEAVRGAYDGDGGDDQAPILGPLLGKQVITNTYEDSTWQLHLAVARARAVLGLPVHDAAKSYENDDRALVRNAFQTIGA